MRYNFLGSRDLDVHLGAVVLPTATFPLGNAGFPFRIWPQTGINAGFRQQTHPKQAGEKRCKTLGGNQLGQSIEL
jgi:hypothetical protein